MHDTYKDSLYILIENGNFQEAASYTYEHVAKNQNKEYFALFYILFRIMEEEQQANVTDFFSSPLGHEPEKLLAHYKQIKLYLRRFEYQLPDDSLQEAIEYFTANQVSPCALYRIAQFACVKPDIAFQELARIYEVNGNHEYAAIFRQTDHDDSQTGNN